jgi:hypothetical protein
MEDDLLIPQYVTQWGILTSFVIMAFSLFAYKLKLNLLCVATLCLFITSVIHWHKMTTFGIIKILDVLCATIVLGLVTFYYINIMKPEYRKLWYYTVVIIIFIYVFNWIITYFQILNNNAIPCQAEYDYFSLQYTNPNTESREKSYYHVTFVHLLCIHVIPAVILTYCLIMSRKI